MTEKFKKCRMNSNEYSLQLTTQTFAQYVNISIHYDLWHCIQVLRISHQSSWLIQKLIWKPFGVIDWLSFKFMLQWKPTLDRKDFSKWDLSCFFCKWTFSQYNSLVLHFYCCRFWLFLFCLWSGLVVKFRNFSSPIAYRGIFFFHSHNVITPSKITYLYLLSIVQVSLS